MTVQDLRPNSQDTSAFYLGNIYEVLADPNVTRASPVAKPPPFSRPRYAIRGNSLLFLSLVISLSCALLAISLQQWARRYIRLTRPARCDPDKRARTRAFYADGVEKMHIPWAVEGLPMLLHLSLFLFFGGLAIFLFNVDVEVLTCVVCWIGLFLLVYGLITLLPLLRYNSPYYTPLSKPVWYLNASIRFVTRAVHHYFSYILLFINRDRRRKLMRWRYDARWNWITRGMEKEAEESATKQSSEIDVRILDWTISALGDDNSQEKFFQTIPGLFSSDLVDIPKTLPPGLFSKFWPALDTFIRHTKISKLISNEVKSHRLNIATDITQLIPFPTIRDLEGISDNYDSEPVSIDRLPLMRPWIDHWSPFIFCPARVGAANMLARMEERDDRWLGFASEVSGLSKWELRLDLNSAVDNMLLSTVINTCREMSHFPGSRFLNEMLTFFRRFDNFDIRRTLPRLQHDFCHLWNKLVQDAKILNWSSRSASQMILPEIRLHYISLHQGTDATLDDRFINRLIPLPGMYPSCGIPSHRPSIPLIPARELTPSTQSGHSPDVSPQQSTPDGSIDSWHDEESIIAGSPSRLDPTTPTIIGENSQDPAAIDSHTTDTPPPSAVATAPQDISPVAMVSYTLQGTAHSVPADTASASNPLLPTSYVINLSITAAPPPSRVPSPCADSITLPSTTTSFHLTGNTTILHPPTRGLVNTGGVCFSNAVLQLLAHTPTLRDVFRVLGDLNGQLGAGDPETAAPLVDATMRFFEEFAQKKPPPTVTQQPPQHAVSEIQREDEEKKEHNAVDLFEPTYIYDAMNEKTQLKDSLVRSRDQDAPLLSLICAGLL